MIDNNIQSQIQILYYVIAASAVLLSLLISGIGVYLRLYTRSELLAMRLKLIEDMREEYLSKDSFKDKVENLELRIAEVETQQGKNKP